MCWFVTFVPERRNSQCFDLVEELGVERVLRRDDEVALVVVVHRARHEDVGLDPEAARERVGGERVERVEGLARGAQAPAGLLRAVPPSSSGIGGPPGS